MSEQSSPNIQDEINAMRIIAEALHNLSDASAIGRVLQWTASVPWSEWRRSPEQLDGIEGEGE